MRDSEKPVDRLSEFPAVLRAVLDAELLAGNFIVEITSCFPAPPAGACAKLARPVTTHKRESGAGLRFRERNSSLCAGEFTDDRGFYFIVEPPGEPPAELDMDAIRQRHRTPPADDTLLETPSPQPATALQRFRVSMVVGYDKWHDGIGYDLDALRGATPDERLQIESLLLSRTISDWRDIEALAALGTDCAKEALRRVLDDADSELALAVTQHAPELVSHAARTRALVDALSATSLFDGLSAALDEAAEFHPPEVIEALLRGTLHREGEAACHFAGLLLFVHGQAAEPFDWQERPFLLRFHTDDKVERQRHYEELCRRIGRTA